MGPETMRKKYSDSPTGDVANVDSRHAAIESGPGSDCMLIGWRSNRKVSVSTAKDAAVHPLSRSSSRSRERRAVSSSRNTSIRSVTLRPSGPMKPTRSVRMGAPIAGCR